MKPKPDWSTLHNLHGQLVGIKVYYTMLVLVLLLHGQLVGIKVYYTMLVLVLLLHGQLVGIKVYYTMLVLVLLLHGQLVGIHVLIFDLNAARSLEVLILLGKIFHILGPSHNKQFQDCCN